MRCTDRIRSGIQTVCLKDGLLSRGGMLPDRLGVGTESERACELLARRVNDIRQTMLGACVCLYSGDR